ncbi:MULTISPECIES: hypothetical protein [Vibrio]|nr:MULTISPECIES: hypothetical protein [Vibrio]
MTINKYYVFKPQALDKQTNQNHEVKTDKEMKRQQAVKQAQSEGGIDK